MAPIERFRHAVIFIILTLLFAPFLTDMDILRPVSFEKIRKFEMEFFQFYFKKLFDLFFYAFF